MKVQCILQPKDLEARACLFHGHAVSRRLTLVRIHPRTFSNTPMRFEAGGLAQN